MINYKQEILEIIATKSLSLDDVAMWTEVIENIPEKYCQAVLDSLKSSASSVIMLTENMRTKIAALKVLDPTEWKRVLEEEAEWTIPTKG